MSLLESLVLASEKAANIARICRQEQCLFELLIQEKKCEEANPRFVQDFKTLADVLIQETVKYDIGRKFPDLKDGIKGEENNIFCNTLGESIYVEIKDTCEATSDLLCQVLNGDKRAADLLAIEVHTDVQLETINLQTPIEKKCDDPHFPSLGIWIDPIDCTNEYIKGVEKEGENGIYLKGLHCVTVLIGAYDKITGVPILGVVNQPFFEKTENTWHGRCFWGFSSISCVSTCAKTNVICLSGSEDFHIRKKLVDHGFHLVEAAGAGYKILTVIAGLADAYVLTKSSTFKWDTCGPQAILKALGGDMLICDDARKGVRRSVNYGVLENENLSKIDAYCNSGGIIAYRCEAILQEVLDVLQTSADEKK